MATIDLPDNLVQTLSLVLNQLQQVLPEPKQETDFTAPAFRWENQQQNRFSN
ncbi:AAA family ATPase, partial [Acinetobacter baumannii]